MSYERTEEHRKKMSEIKKQNWENPAYRKKQLKAAFKRWQNPDFRKRMCGKFREKNSAWKGGRWISKYGYTFIFAPDHPRCNSAGYIQEHRLIVEERLHRYLLPKERVHHINGIKTDNRPENLMAFCNQSAHRRFENKKHLKPEEIIYNGQHHSPLNK